VVWQDLEGHDTIVERFRRAIKQGRLAHAYLFVGPPGIGKRRFAFLLAKSLFCSAQPAEKLQPCCRCRNCILAEAGTHPDLLTLSKPEEKSEFPVQLLIGDRGEGGVLRALAIKPALATRRVLILDDADFLNPESANALLKTLEEPPAGAIIFLIGTSAAKQLPTIRSRCQIVNFQPLPEKFIARKLVEMGYATTMEQAQLVAASSGGSLARAIEISQLETAEIREFLRQAFSHPKEKLLGFLPKAIEFVENAPSPGEAKLRSRLIFEWAVQYCKEKLADIWQNSARSDTADRAQQFTAAEDSTNEAKWVEAWALTLEMEPYLERNVNRSTLLQAWIQRMQELL
jgi:DNA polymerase-3 subunit delta'